MIVKCSPCRHELRISCRNSGQDWRSFIAFGSLTCITCFGMGPLERIRDVKYLRDNKVRIDHPTIDHHTKNQARNEFEDTDKRRPFATLEDRIAKPRITLAKTRD